MNRTFPATLLLAVLPLHAETLCLYTEDGTCIDRYERAEIIFRTVQAKNAEDKTVIPLSAGYKPLHPEHTQACFSNLNWLMKNGSAIRGDTQGKILYEGVLSSDMYLLTEADDAGYFPVKQNGLYGYADAKTGSIRIAPQFAAAFAFKRENGGLKAVATDKTETYSHSHTDYLPAHYSNNWFYIDPDGNRLPHKPDIPNGCLPEPYCSKNMPAEIKGRLKARQP